MGIILIIGKYSVRSGIMVHRWHSSKLRVVHKFIRVAIIRNVMQEKNTHKISHQARNRQASDQEMTNHLPRLESKSGGGKYHRVVSNTRTDTDVHI